MKTKTNSTVKQGTAPVFGSKQNMPFVAIDHQIDKELERLERFGMIINIEETDWAEAAVWGKMKNKKLRVFTD